MAHWPTSPSPRAKRLPISPWPRAA
jgi:hypothetical protein